MTNVTHALKDWQSILALSKTMLELAHHGNWDELIAQEVKYLQLVEDIGKNPIPLNEKVQSDHARLILEQVLFNEESLKILLNARMDELRQLISNTGNQRSVTTAYGKLAGNVLFPKFPQ
jgi:flagellar protein FliT